jgi:antitoxin ParD1/3/4
MKTAEKISITMIPEMMQVIRESVDIGEFASTSGALRDAVRVWQRQRAEHSERLNAIRARIRRSLDDPQPDISGAEVDERLEELFASARKDAGRG